MDTCYSGSLYTLPSFKIYYLHFTTHLPSGKILSCEKESRSLLNAARRDAKDWNRVREVTSSKGGVAKSPNSNDDLGIVACINY